MLMVFSYQGTVNTFKLGNGNIAAPSLGFSNTASTGFFYANGNIGITVGGSEKMRISTDGLTIYGNITANTYTGNGMYLSDWDSLVNTSLANVQIANSTYVATGNTTVPTAGGFIILNGNGFVGGSMVLVDDIPAPSTSVTSFTRLNAQVAAKTAGTYSLRVVQPNSVSVALPAGLTYV